jgi:hypothetical protein
MDSETETGTDVLLWNLLYFIRGPRDLQSFAAATAKHARVNSRLRT